MFIQKKIPNSFLSILENNFGNTSPDTLTVLSCPVSPSKNLNSINRHLEALSFVKNILDKLQNNNIKAIKIIKCIDNKTYNFRTDINRFLKRLQPLNTIKMVLNSNTSSNITEYFFLHNITYFVNILISDFEPSNSKQILQQFHKTSLDFGKFKSSIP